jgi:uncharacterized membrane protein
MRRRWYGLVIAAVAVAVSIWAYPRLPARIPTHWNIHGEPSGYSSRLLGVLLMPLMILVLTGVAQVLPRIDPRRANYAKFIGVYWLMINYIVLFMAVIHCAMLANALGAPVNLTKVGLAGVGLLLALLGNYLRRVEPNWFLGIRTPWTLSSDTVWRETHRVGGWVFVVGGLVLVGCAFLHPPAVYWVFGITIGLVAIVPIVLSYVLWRRERPR